MRRVILDTDLSMGEPGSEIDDGFALALAHAAPEIALEMITTVNGNTDVETATVLTLELVDRLGIRDVPVVRGAATALIRPQQRKTPSADVLQRYAADRKPAPGYAPAELARVVMDNPGEITILAVGPLTNIAAAIAMEPDLPTAVQEIVIMGGIFLGSTKQRRHAGEWNVWVDPEAAAAVLRSGAPQRWVGLDVTQQVRLTRRDAAELSASSGRFSQYAGESTTIWIDKIAAQHSGDALQQNSCAMHDPLAVAAITRPELLTWSDAQVEIVTGEGVARGVMITDLLQADDPPMPNVKIATDVRAGDFTRYFLDAIRSL